MNIYDLTYIAAGGDDANILESAKQEVAGILSKHGVTVKKEIVSDAQKLAYEIKKEKYGIYVRLFIEAEPNVVAALHKELEHADHLLRHLLIKLEPADFAYLEQKGSESTDALAGGAGSDAKNKPAKPRASRLMDKTLKPVKKSVLAAITERIIGGPKKEAETEAKIADAPTTKKVATDTKAKDEQTMKDIDKQIDKILDEDLVD